MKKFRNYSLFFFILGITASFSQNSAKAQGTWTQVDNVNEFRPRACATALYLNDKIWVIGFDSLQIFDPVALSWNTPPSASTYIPSPGYEGASNRLLQGTACFTNGKIYYFGGYSDYAPDFNLIPNTLHLLDTSTLTWSEPKTIGFFQPRQGLMSAVVDGKIYAIGGNTDTNLAGASGDLSTLQVFDTGTMTWSTPTTNGSLIPGEGQSCCVLNGKIYVIGGAQYGSSSISATANQVFDPSTNTWSTISSKGMFLRWYPSVVALNDKIYLIGGQVLDDSGGIIDTALDDGGGGGDGTQIDIQIYDPTTDTWSTPYTSGLFIGVFGASAVVVNNKVYVLAGDNGDISNAVQVFDPNASAGVNTTAPVQQLSIYPNPLAQSTTLSFTAPESGYATVSIVNQLGESVAQVFSGEIGAGEHSFSWNPNGLPVGTYWCIARMNGSEETVPVIVSR